jgi:hypothetical protein
MLRKGLVLPAELTNSDVDDGSQVEPLLEPITGALAAFIGDGIKTGCLQHAQDERMKPAQLWSYVAVYGSSRTNTSWIFW